MISLSITECRIVNMYHVADLSQPFCQRRSAFCSVSLGACFSTNAERSMIDLRVLRQSALSQTADGRVPIQDVFGDGEPTFQLQASTAVDQADQTGTMTDLPPSSGSYELLLAPLQPTKQRARSLQCIPLYLWKSTTSRRWRSTL